MEKQQLYQTIEAYLEGELPEKEQLAFERELATDTTLAKEVELHRSLQQQLGDAYKMRLRATLDTIAEEFPESDLSSGENDAPNSPQGTGNGSGGGIPFWWWGLGFFLIVGGSITWYLTSREPEPILLSPDSQIESQEEMPTAADPATDMDPTVGMEGAEAENDTQTPSATDTEPSTPEENKGPQAYDTNRNLELLLDGDPPSKRYSFTDGELNYLQQGDQSYLSYSGKLETSRSVGEGFYLSLYTNQYPEGRVFREALTFSEVNPDAPIAFAAKKEYVAAYTGETDLSPALYYGVVTIGNSSIPLWVGKVRVE